MEGIVKAPMLGDLGDAGVCTEEFLVRRKDALAPDKGAGSGAQAVVKQRVDVTGGE